MAARSERKAARPVGAKTVDDYLAQVEPPARAALMKLRAQIRGAAPMAREVVSYQIPTYLHHGPLVHFAQQPRHLAIYGVSRAILRAHKDELKAFDVQGQTIRFSPEKPLPAGLVKRMVRARVRENEARVAKKARA